MTRTAQSTAATSAAPLDKRATLDRIRDAGLVGMGGAGFPTHVKYDAKVDTVLANGAECEPLLWTDKQYLLHWPDELVRGLELAIETVGAERGVIGIKGKYTAVVEAVESALRARGPGGPPIEVVRMPNIYPSGDEFTLVQQALGRTIPEMGLPLHVGVVVSNVATLHHLARGLLAGEPLTSRLVTVCGEVRSPAVVEAPVGTSMTDLLAAAGGTTRDDVALVDGGPMMGHVTSPDAAMKKTCSGIVVLPASQPVVQRKLEGADAKLRVARAACCSCQECTEVCPRNALGHRIFPHRLMQSVASGITHDVRAEIGALQCCECGQCTEYGCPLYLDPCRMNIECKQLLRAQGISYPDPRASTPSRFFAIKQVPASRLAARLGLSRYLGEIPLAPAPLRPARVELALRQGIGQPCKPVVAKGDRVRVGQLVAEPGGPLCAALHASIDGVVERVDAAAIALRRDA
jgi:Na+-translocating ferredoxin:NAD+ oxidoreductase RnfC subunit